MIGCGERRHPTENLFTREMFIFGPICELQEDAFFLQCYALSLVIGCGERRHPVENLFTLEVFIFGPTCELQEGAFFCSHHVYDLLRICHGRYGTFYLL